MKARRRKASSRAEYFHKPDTTPLGRGPQYRFLRLVRGKIPAEYQTPPRVALGLEADPGSRNSDRSFTYARMNLND
jgi:hypothetical protein